MMQPLHGSQDGLSRALAALPEPTEMHIPEQKRTAAAEAAGRLALAARGVERARYQRAWAAYERFVEPVLLATACAVYLLWAVGAAMPPAKAEAPAAGQACRDGGVMAEVLVVAGGDGIRRHYRGEYCWWYRAVC